jgi:hypothetical protein
MVLITKGEAISDPFLLRPLHEQLLQYISIAVTLGLCCEVSHGPM